MVNPTRRRLKRAARSGDLFAIRRAAETYLRRQRELGLPVSGRETAELDAAIYVPNVEVGEFDRLAGAKAIFGHLPSLSL